MPADHPHMTPPTIAKLYVVSPDKVLAWIRSGELRAINVVSKAGGRPRYRVSAADLAAFEAARAAVPARPTRPSRQRKPKPAAGFVQYF